MSFTAWIEAHRRSLLFVVAALAAAGLYAATVLPVGLFPQVSFPRVVINVDAGDRPAEQMTLLVAKPLEQAVRRVPGIGEVRSISSRGAASISLNFDWGLDMIAATVQVDAAIAQVLPSLPAGTTYTVRRMDPTVFPIIAYGMISDTLSPVALRDLASFQIVPLLSTIPGVSRVDVQGGATAEIEVTLDPARLDAQSLALNDIVQALGSANVLSAVGRIEDHDKLYLVVADQQLRELEQVRDVVVASGPTGIVRLNDVATVKMSTAPQWIRVDADGHDAVLFQVYAQPNGNAVEIAKGVREKLAAFQPLLPAGVSLTNWYDQSVLVTDSLASVRDSVLIGLGLAAIVLLAFLRSGRTTVIAIVIVPATLAITMLLLGAIGQSFNIMTLGGIAAAVGLLIDDVIVMVEHIIRRAGDSAADRRGAVILEAGREFLAPLAGSSLATLIVFIPLGFLSGVTGAFSKALSLTMGLALIISFLLTAFAVPLLARLILDPTRPLDPHAGKPEGRLAQAHRRTLGRLIAAPWLLLPVLGALAVLGWIAYSGVGTGFMPALDEGGFVLDYRSLPGTALSETDREARQVEAILSSTPDVATFSRRTGLGLGGDLNEPNQGDFFVRLKPSGRRPIDEVMAEVRARVEAEVPGFEIELAQLMEDLIGDLTAVPQPIEIKLSAANLKDLNPSAEAIAEGIASVPGVVEIKSGVVLAGDALNIQVDPAKVAIEGADPDLTARTLDSYMNGAVATQLPGALKQIGVRVRLPQDSRTHDSDLARMKIRAPDGHLFPLGRVAAITPDPGQPEIARDNLRQIVAVTARIEGRDLGSTVTDVRALLDKPGTLKAGVTYELGGLYRQQQIAFSGLAKVFLAAIAAEFFLLLYLYERFWIPIIVIGLSLFSTTAVFSALWLTGIELNITAMMGMTMVIGIATEMAIFYVSEFEALSSRMPEREALVEAALNRFRPIAMTTLAAILTLLPLALAIGQGAGMQQPLAIAIIAGLILQFPLVLLVMPVLIGLTLGRRARSRPASPMQAETPSP